MIGILKTTFKLLANDRAKLDAVLIGTTFAVFLVVRLTSIFSGVLTKALVPSIITNVRSSIRVMDPSPLALERGSSKIGEAPI